MERYKIEIISALLVLLMLEGCNNPNQARSKSKIDTPVGMMEYLQKSNLPALEKVEDWDNEYGPGLKLTTRHYEVYTTLLEPLMLSYVPGFLESSWRAYNRQLPEPVESDVKFKMYLFAYRSQWEDITKKLTGPQSSAYLKIQKGAYYLNGVCVAYNIGIEKTFSALGHEGWHQFSNRFFSYRLPSWADEGIAMQFEASRNDRGIFTFIPERNLYRLGPLRQTLSGNNMISLSELVAMNPGEAVTASEQATAAFYSQAYALVRFLREDGYGKRLAVFQQMLMDGLNGKWELSESGKKIASDRNIPQTVGWNKYLGTELFEQYIGNPEQIENEYVMFCRKIVYNVRPAAY